MKTTLTQAISLRAVAAGSALPGRDIPGTSLTNEALAQLSENACQRMRDLGSERSLLPCNADFPLSRIGVSARRILDERFGPRDLAERAASRALKRAAERLGESAEHVASRVRAVIVSTVTNPEPVPALATSVAGRLGVPNDVFATDIVLGCNGFMGALGLAHGLLAGEDPDALAIVVGAEAMTRVLDASDRQTLPIFGDGAGALIVQRPKLESRGGFHWRTLPKGSERIRICHRDLDELPVLRLVSRGNRVTVEPDTRSRHVVELEGQRVFRDMVRLLPDFVRGALDSEGTAFNEISHFCLHQANARLNDAVLDDLAVDEAKRLRRIAELGNTTSASIPLALARASADGSLRSGQLILLVGFGTGYSAGLSTIQWL